jgi:hypothetical protein
LHHRSYLFLIFRPSGPMLIWTPSGSFFS